MEMEELRSKIKEEDVRHIGMVFFDLFGNRRMKYVTADELLSNTHVSWVDGMSIDGTRISSFRGHEESEWLLIKPDFETFKTFELESEEKTIGLTLCNLKDFSLGTRAIAKKAEEYCKEKGFTPIFGPKFQFSIENRDKEGEEESYSSIEQDEILDFKLELVEELDRQGIEIEYHYVEGTNQVNIDMIPQELVKASDNIMYLKVFAQMLARRRGLKVSFSSKKNKMRTHFSLWKNDQNKFFDPEGEYELSEIGRGYINGVLENTETINQFTNPNSYKQENYVKAWSTERDNSVVNVPMYYLEKDKEDRVGWSKRAFYKNIYSDANPYLAFSAILLSGIETIEKEKTSSDRYRSEGSEKLKENQIQNVEEANELVREIFGDDFLSFYSSKMQESN